MANLEYLLRQYSILVASVKEAARRLLKSNCVLGMIKWIHFVCVYHQVSGPHFHRTLTNAQYNELSIHTVNIGCG